MFTPNREELAWAAGFYDGEGSLIATRDSRTGKKYIGIFMSICQVEKGPLDRFQGAINGLGTMRHEQNKNNSARPIWRLQLQRHETVQAALAMMWPFLCQPKKDQALRAFNELREYYAATSWYRWNPAQQDQGCERCIAHPIARGMCTAHYQRWYKQAKKSPDWVKRPWINLECL